MSTSHLNDAVQRTGASRCSVPAADAASIRPDPGQPQLRSGVNDAEPPGPAHSVAVGCPRRSAPRPPLNRIVAGKVQAPAPSIITAVTKGEEMNRRSTLSTMLVGLAVAVFAVVSCASTHPYVLRSKASYDEVWKACVDSVFDVRSLSVPLTRRLV